jgi:hypothetical protein
MRSPAVEAVGAGLPPRRRHALVPMPCRRHQRRRPTPKTKIFWKSVRAYGVQFSTTGSPLREECGQADLVATTEKIAPPHAAGSARRGRAWLTPHRAERRVATRSPGASRPACHRHYDKARWARARPRNAARQAAPRRLGAGSAPAAFLRGNRLLILLGVGRRPALLLAPITERTGKLQRVSAGLQWESRVLLQLHRDAVADESSIRPLKSSRARYLAFNSASAISKKFQVTTTAK